MSWRFKSFPWNRRRQHLQKKTKRKLKWYICRAATNKLHVYRIPVPFFRRFKKQTLVTFRDASKRGLLRNPLFFSRIERNPGKCWENECLESTNRDDGRVFVSRVASTRAEFYMLILMYRWFEILRVTAAKHQNIRYSVWSDLRNIRNANRKYICIFIRILRRTIEISWTIFRYVIAWNIFWIL